MNDNAHYPHDVIAGATVGIAYGLGLYYLGLKKTEKTETKTENSSQTFVVPLTELGGAAVVYSKDF